MLTAIATKVSALLKSTRVKRVLLRRTRLPAMAFFCIWGSVMGTGAVLAQSLTEQLEQGLGLADNERKQSSNTDTNKSSSVQSLDALLAQDDANPSAADQQVDSQQNLADQIETLKQAMVNLNRDLFILEEDLLFPPSTQLAVYLSMDVGEYFALDAVEIRIDGEVKTYYLYTERQVNALYRGGVQRLYLDNVNQGEHELSAYFVGIGPQSRNYKRAVSIRFTKQEDPVAIELSVIDSTDKQQPTFIATTL